MEHPLRVVPDLPDTQEQPPGRLARGATVRLDQVQDGVPRIGGLCIAAQKRCGHHGEPTAQEVVEAVGWLGRTATTAELVAALLERRGCTASRQSEGLKNHLGRLAKSWPAGCGHGVHVAAEPGRSRQWRPCEDPCPADVVLH
jgi:hypothetical protein